MYMDPRFSLSTASSMSRCAWPSTDSGRLGIALTPMLTPFSRPARSRTHECRHVNAGPIASRITDTTQPRVSRVYIE